MSNRSSWAIYLNYEIETWREDRELSADLPIPVMIRGPDCQLLECVVRSKSISRPAP